MLLSWSLFGFSELTENSILCIFNQLLQGLSTFQIEPYPFYLKSEVPLLFIGNHETDLPNEGRVDFRLIREKSSPEAWFELVEREHYFEPFSFDCSE